jgi:plastocyanin
MAPPKASVSVGDNFFDPTQSTIAVAGTVTWTWTGSSGHNVTFGSGASPTQSSGTYAMDFPTAGSFAYQCTIHPGQMNGTIVVQ